MTWLALLIGPVGLIYTAAYMHEKKNAVPGLPVTVAPSMSEKIYQAAVTLLGRELYDLMTPSVPASEGCAASVSYVLKEAGCNVPMGGLLTVNTLIEWLVAHGQEVTEKEAVPGCIITAHSPDVTDPQWAHTGVVAKTGVISNTSFPVAGFKAGEWAENYSGDNFQKSFKKQGSIIRYFIVQ